MPKFGAHILFAEIAERRRPDLFDGADNALRFGAIGPDTTLFLFDPVTMQEVRQGYDVAIKVLRFMRDIKRRLREIEEIFEGPFRDLEDWVSDGLSTELRETIDLSIDAMLLAAKLGLTDEASSLNIQNPLYKYFATGQLPPGFLSDPAHEAPIFLVDATDNYGFPLRYFGHPLTDDGQWKRPEPTGDYSKWWWMDMLHYRNTGTFAKSLLANAKGPLETAYARGYLSHVAGDICGHPFINALVGGPFRNHAYRHMVLESLADTWLWAKERNQCITRASLNNLIDLSNPDAVRIAKLVRESMMQVYRPPQVPDQLPGRYPSENEFVTAYRAMQIYLDLSTNGGIERPKPPPDSPQEVWEEIEKLLQRNNPGPSPPWDPANPVSCLVAILGWLLRGVVFAAMIATLPAEILKRLVNAAPRWLLYFVRLAIFTIVSGLRMLLAFMGWGYAGRDDFETFGFLEGFVTATWRGLDGKYPLANPRRPKPAYYWMVNPVFLADQERERTVSMVFRGSALPDILLDPANEFSEAAVARLLSANSPEATRIVQTSLVDSPAVFGNAPDYFNLLLSGAQPVPDLDLDGDRGFGFKPWEELPPNERYV